MKFKITYKYFVNLTLQIPSKLPRTQNKIYIYKVSYLQTIRLYIIATKEDPFNPLNPSELQGEETSAKFVLLVDLLLRAQEIQYTSMCICSKSVFFCTTL